MTYEEAVGICINTPEVAATILMKSARLEEDLIKANDEIKRLQEIKNLEIVDKEIAEHLKQREISDVGFVERAILRLSIYEILFSGLDKPIIINEAIELSKRLASDNAPKFINGVLDSIEKK